MRIAVDIMGGDQAPRVLYESVQEADRLYQGQHTFCVLHERGVELPPPSSSIELIETGSSVTMDTSPLTAVRERKDSSMITALSYLQQGNVDALVTTGNTGALVVNAKLQLPLISNVSKPALLATLPSQAGPIALIDAGALVRPSFASLKDFAYLGALYQHLIHNKQRVSVGLLNIGSERGKGTEALQKAFSALEENDHDIFPFEFCFVGNIEARDVFTGSIDVVVTDGFTGNVFLKSIEGTSEFILKYLKDVLPSSILKEANLERAFHYQEYPGALLCGVEGLVIKSHGYSTVQSFFLSIVEAIKFAEKGLIQKMKALYPNLS